MADYPDFIESTGYGDVAGLLGANCRHSFSPFYPGISTPRWSEQELKDYKEKKYTEKRSDGSTKEWSAYDALQFQRRLERTLRRWKQIEAVEQAKGELCRPDVITEAKSKIKEWSKRIDNFTLSTGLRRQPFRERIAKP